MRGWLEQQTLLIVRFWRVEVCTFGKEVTWLVELVDVVMLNVIFLQLNSSFCELLPVEGGRPADHCVDLIYDRSWLFVAGTRLNVLRGGPEQPPLLIVRVWRVEILAPLAREGIASLALCVWCISVLCYLTNSVVGPLSLGGKIALSAGTLCYSGPPSIIPISFGVTA
eukprot:g81683.t1